MIPILVYQISGGQAEKRHAYVIMIDESDS